MFRFLIVCSLFIISSASFCQQLRINGVVRAGEQPLAGANVIVLGTESGSQTNLIGEFSLILPSADTVILVSSFIGYVTDTTTLLPKGDSSITINIYLNGNTTLLQTVKIQDERNREQVSVTEIEPKTIKALPSAFGDFGKVIAMLPGVVSNNELSSSYSVRGGSFDENLVYVNDIPVYRPFLISNGQQEGLSFVNTDMVGSVAFSAGGWQPVYGDKLSSVLNVYYKTPKKFGASGTISLLGGSAHIEGSSSRDRINYIVGIRHKSSQYLLNTLEVDGEYLPKFTDVQGYLNFNLGPENAKNKTTLGVLANYSRNRYLVEPEARETEFGTFTQTLRLYVAFEGKELLEYDTYQTGLKLTHQLNDSWQTKLIVSGVTAYEREYTDVEGGYRLCDVDTNIGSASFNDCVTIRGIGTSYDYGRNTLEAQLLNVEDRNTIILDSKNEIGFGVGYAVQNIDDQLNEFNFIDSAGYVTDITSADSKNSINSNQYTAYVQHTHEFNHRFTTTYGIRANYWDYNDQLLLSPRAQVSYRPGWVRDIIFKGAVGIYQQPPFYRELRDFQGNVNKGLKAQRALHVLGGFDYNFRWWDRPFKLTGDAYYKKIWEVVPFDIDNVKVRYYAKNNAEAYAAGLDFRLSGEFIQGTQSWFSLGLMHVREDVEGDGRGYIRRPTDQRVTAAVFFQDHLPDNPTFRVSLSLLFGSGLPFGPPNDFKNRNLFNNDSYRRVDIGFTKQFFFKNEDQWILATAEILNLLGTSNPISYTWITDVSDTQIAVPNSLSARFLNIKLSIKI